MSPKELAEFFALLTILEPDTIICKLAARLATASTASEGETDHNIILEMRQHSAQIAEELASLSAAKLDRKAALVGKFFDAAHAGHGHAAS